MLELFIIGNLVQFITITNTPEVIMDNKAKLEFLLKLQRREKQKRIVFVILFILLLGVGIIYSQVKNMAIA